MIGAGLSSNENGDRRVGAGSPSKRFWTASVRYLQPFLAVESNGKSSLYASMRWQP